MKDSQVESPLNLHAPLQSILGQRVVAQGTPPVLIRPAQNLRCTPTADKLLALRAGVGLFRSLHAYRALQG